MSGDAAPLFRRRTAWLLSAAAVFGLVLILWQTAVAPDFRGRRDGGAHALSVAATGFAGILQLARDTGVDARTARDLFGDAQAGLLVVVLASPDPNEGGGSEAVRMDPLLTARGSLPTLLVLTKWQTIPDRDHPGFVREIGIDGPVDLELPVGNRTKISLHVGPRTGGGDVSVSGPLLGGQRWLPPTAVQTLTGGRIDPVLSDGSGAVVLGRVRDTAVYVLADPDLLDNHGLRDRDTARAGLTVLRALTPAGGTLVFDLTQNGFGRTRSLLRLAFEPPFVSATAALLFAALLALLGSSHRFGPALATPRALPFGKTALVDNAAALIMRARRFAPLGGRYAGAVRDAAAQAAGAPRGLSAAALDAWLDRRAPAPFTPLATAAANAKSEGELLAAARALHAWKDSLADAR